jgi:hypothetical protein
MSTPAETVVAQIEAWKAEAEDLARQYRSIPMGMAHREAAMAYQKVLNLLRGFDGERA